MEDHKRKNKKRNQNKKPTQEQIKKIQGNADQRKDNVNGTDENEKKESITKPVLNEASSHSENEVARKPNIVNGEHNGKEIKKPKRKNKQKENQKDSQDEDQKVNDQKQDLNQANINIIVDEVVKNLPMAEKEPFQSMQGNTPEAEQNGGNATLSTQQLPSESTPCHQFHNDEAPTCSHHIQHQLNNLKMGNLKIDFDVQKHLSPMGTQSDGSNNEYFYKGFNVEQLIAGSNGKDKVQTNGNLQQEELNSLPAKKTGDTKQNDQALQNPQHQMSDSSPETMLNNMLRNAAGGLDPNEIMKNMFGSAGISGEPPAQNKMTNNMTGSSGAQPNPNDILKNMFGNSGPPPIPKEMLEKMFANSSGAPNPNEMLKNMFGNGGNPGAVPNSNDLLKNMFANGGGSETQPNPNDMLKNMFGNSSTAPNPNELLKNIFGSSQNEDETMEIDPQAMFGQVNAMMQNMDPNMMASMSQMMSNMDPTILAGMTNMVAGMMQGGGLNLQNIMQMKEKKSQGAKMEENNVVENTKNHGDSQNIRNKEPEASKLEISKEEKGDPKIQDEPALKCNFSFSSNSSEKTEGDDEDTSSEQEAPEQQNSEINEEKPVVPKIKRFVREESIPELLENLINVGTKKEVTEIKKVEVKTNKIKTILSKVLKKEKKVVAGDSSVQSIEIREHRVECQNIVIPNKTKTVEKAIDYEKLQHVKEPLEHPDTKAAHQKTKGKDFIQTSSKVKDIKDSVKDEESQFKETGEQIQENQFLNPSGEKFKPQDFEFNPKNMNALFTNLLQDKKLGEIKSQDLDPNSVTTKNNQSESKTAFETVLSNMSNLIQNGGAENGNTPLENMMMQQNLFVNLMQTQNPKVDLSKNGLTESITAQSPDNIESMMSQMMGAFSSFKSQGNDDNSNPFNLGDTMNKMMQMFNNTNASSSPNVLESISDMFNQLLPNNTTSSDLDMSTIMSNPENIKNILKMGEMIFGKSPFDLDGENSQPSESDESVNEQSSDKSIEEDNIKVNTPSKNFYQDERPSVLLKELLGDKFWSIRKKRNDLAEKSEVKSKINKNKQKENCKTRKVDNSVPVEKAESSTPKKVMKKSSEDSLNDFNTDLEKESPFVRMMHKKLQKDSKLQEFLKSKLQKDPKMQKFIQDRLKKDEKFQKFIREKLANNKEMRENFQEKFKSELGLTIEIPDIDGDNASGDGNGQVENHKDVGKSDEAETPNSNGVQEEGEKSKNHTNKLLMKKYAELTMMLCGIVYMGVLCY